MNRARPEAVLEQLGGGCTATHLAKMDKAERKKHQKGPRRIRPEVASSISAFKRLLGEPVRAMKPEYIIDSQHNKTRDIMREDMGAA